MRFGRSLFAVTALLMLVAGAATATEGPLLRIVGASVNPTGDLRQTESDSIPLGDGTTLTLVEQIDVEADNAFGFCVDFEYRFNELFGLDFALMNADPDVDLTGTETARLTDDATNTILFESTDTIAAQASSGMTPLLVGSNFHFGGSEKVDLYGGPFVGWIFFDDIELLGERVDVKDDFAYGATLGLDVPFGQGGMMFSGAVRYMIASAETDEPDSATLDIDPWIVLLGLGYSF